jgi:threonine aldolase
VKAISAWARSHNLLMHLDGARLWNAIVAAGVAGHEWAKHFDTVSVCFSKGLGAPVGSALAGPKDFITKARRYRKIFGGAMRQAGVLASACIYAMDHHIERLADDHRNAQVIAEAIADVPGLKLVPPDIHTNLVWFEIDPDLGSAKDVFNGLKERGVLVGNGGEQVLRACTHLDISAADAERAADIIRKTLRRTVAAR